MKTLSSRRSPCRKEFDPVILSGLILIFSSGMTSGRNAIIFVADGLRQGSVNEEDAPTMSLVRKEGVFFANSHSLFPTLTTRNASALATGHYLGDTGDFSNVVYAGYPLPMLGETQTPAIENDRVLGNLDDARKIAAPDFRQWFNRRNRSYLDPVQRKANVTANGGSDLIYLNDRDPALVKDLVNFLSRQEYVSGIFTDPKFGEIEGGLSLSDIHLKGSSVLPTPAIIVNFRSFSWDVANPLQSAVTICDTGLQEGQGMHGSFSRADTLNNMAAIGPDFKKSYIDPAPVGNADVAVTLAHLLNLELPKKGSLTGRVIDEALTRRPERTAFESGIKESKSNSAGIKTRLSYQRVGETWYFDSAGFAGRTVALPGD